MSYELLIQHGSNIMYPPTVEGVTIEWERKGQPGKLTFEVVKTPGLSFQEGDPCRFSVDGTPVFYGFVFEKSRKGNNPNVIKCVVYVYGDNVIEKHGINRDSTGDREKTRYLCGKQGIFTRDRALIRPGFIRQLETRASTRSASFFHALGSPGRPHNGGGEAGAYRTRNGAKPLKQGHLRAKRGPLGPSRKSQQQTKRTGFAAHGHSIAETAPEGKRASCANGALIRA